MKPPRQVTFLSRDTYRRRRVRDAARLLPIFGAGVFLLPVVWAASEAGAPDTAQGFIFVFSVWAGLILLAAGLSRLLRASNTDEGDRDGTDQP